jgi:YesN/AraC family two-component response regulator
VLNLEKSTTSQNEHGQRSEERMVELHALLTEIHNMLQHQQSLNEASKQIDSIWVKATDNGARLEEISARLEENRVSLDGIKEQAQKQLSRYEGLTRVLYTKGQEGIKNAVAKMEETKATVIRTLDAVMETQDLAGQTHEIGKKLRDIFTI